MSLGNWLKDVFGDARLVSRLETDLDALRLDMNERLRDKDAAHALLRQELDAERARALRLELVVMQRYEPRTRTIHDVDKAKDVIEPTTNWAKYKLAAEKEAQEQYEKENHVGASGQN